MGEGRIIPLPPSSFGLSTSTFVPVWGTKPKGLVYTHSHPSSWYLFFGNGSCVLWLKDTLPALAQVQEEEEGKRSFGCRREWKKRALVQLRKAFD